MFIEDNIQSVLNQNYSDFEHIIMDGGSTDNTIEILKQYPHLIWKSEKDRGQTHALNKALSIATGDIICWLNSDDLLCDGAFNAVIKTFTTNREIHVLVGGLRVVDENKNTLWERHAQKIEYDKLLNKGQSTQSMSTFFKKKVFEEVGNFDESYNYTMDHEFFVRVAQKRKFYTINETLAIFRRYPESKTGSSQLEFVKETIRLKIKHNAKVFTLDNLRLLHCFVKAPFKRIHWLRMFVRKVKGAHPDYRHYN